MPFATNQSKGLVIGIAGCLWLALCYVSWHIVDNTIARAAAYVWLATTLVLPMAFAISGALLLQPTSHALSQYPLVRVLLSLAIIGCFVVGYAMCFAVLDRISALWWEHVKFGGDSISLGKAAAQFFSLIAVAIGSAAYGLHRWAPVGLRIAFFSRAALGLILAASFLYLVLGVSPYVSWRA